MQSERKTGQKSKRPAGIGPYPDARRPQPAGGLVGSRYLEEFEDIMEPADTSGWRTSGQRSKESDLVSAVGSAADHAPASPPPRPRRAPAQPPGDAQAEAPGAPPDDDEETTYVPVEHDVLRRKQQDLLTELEELGYKSLDDAMERCPVCWLDIDRSSASVSETDDSGASGSGAKEESRHIARGFFLTYVDNVHLQSNVVFALMEQYWNRRHVAVYKRFDREYIELRKAEIQVHYQYCNNDSPIERIKHQLLVLDLMLTAVSGSGLFMRESKHGALMGPIRVSIPATKIYGELQKQSLALAHQLGILISHLRQQYGRPEVALPATTIGFGKGPIANGGPMRK